MRYTLISILLLLFCGVAFSQQRILVSPDQEVVLLSPGKSATNTINSFSSRVTSGSVGCDDDGFTIDPIPNLFVGAKHRDVLGQWYVAPADGTIDTIFFATGLVGAYDSIAYVRIHKSYIGPEFGPGIRPGPYNPPCQSWGYWNNTNDADMGIAAFQEEATDTEWVSTIFGSPVPSLPPFGEELWGGGGFPVHTTPYSSHFVVISDLFPLHVKKGDVFFISISMGFNPDAGGLHYPDETFTSIAGYHFPVNTSSVEYPSRLWKFYEHDKGTNLCPNIPIDSAKRGWIARGSVFDSDSLTVALLDIWYTMTVDSNSPPFINLYGNNTTFDTGPTRIYAYIDDCNIAHPENAGVDSAYLQYSINNIDQLDSEMTPDVNNLWSVILPVLPAGSVIRYRVKAIDLDGAVSYSPYEEYKIITFGNNWYSLDTSSSCAINDIRTSGTTIPLSAFFDAPHSNSGSPNNRLNNGTAGPIDMGGNFVIFGDAFRYAWVGINGAIALSKSPTDTIDVNSNGAFTSQWDFPAQQYSDRYNAGSKMPPMFIAPMWMNLMLLDSLRIFGRVVYGNNNDPCTFIVEWDSVDDFTMLPAYEHWPPIYNNTFRVILNKCDGTVEFQYEESIGSHSYGYFPRPLLVGMQGTDSTIHTGTGWIFINRNGYPVETRPRSNWCVKMTPVFNAVTNDGWNLVSVPCEPVDANWTKTHIFPQAISPAFSFEMNYTPKETLEAGKGYWMKFNGSQLVSGLATRTCSTHTFAAHDGWNLIGSLSCPVWVEAITAGGNSVISSLFYGYNGGYSSRSVILPGQAAWVKVDGEGTLTLNCQTPKVDLYSSVESMLNNLNNLTISDAKGNTQMLYIGEQKILQLRKNYYELPPVPPTEAFDVRFTAAGKMVETYPEILEEPVEFPIGIQSALYPISINWETNPEETRQFELIAGGTSIDMSRAGTKVITDSKIKALILRVSKGDIPKEFALSQNYPNPFNPVTRFRVDVAATSPVEIAVFDVLGRKIATLLNEEKAAGTYTMEWNGEDTKGLVVPTGMYFIRMTAGEFTDSKKVIFMK